MSIWYLNDTSTNLYTHCNEVYGVPLYNVMVLFFANFRAQVVAASRSSYLFHTFYVLIRLPDLSALVVGCAVSAKVPTFVSPR